MFIQVESQLSFDQQKINNYNNNNTPEDKKYSVLLLYCSFSMQIITFIFRPDYK